MKKLFTESEYKSASYSDMLALECYECNKTFSLPKMYIKDAYSKNHTTQAKFCSLECSGQSRLKAVKLQCSNCNIEIIKTPSEIKKSKSGNFFCSRSCAAKFNNKNKSHGTRRSKLETWLESKLIKKYTNLDIRFNEKDAIGSELDIYIPELNLAFELNGIFHYEPIYGVDKLQQIQENDKSKSKACHDAKIDLCIVDTSGQKYFKPKTSERYLNILTQIIDSRIQ